MGLLDTVFGKKAPQLGDPSQYIAKEDLMNRYNIESAFGGRSITTDPSGRTTVQINESPFQKQLRQLQEQKALGFYGGGGGDYGRESVINALFEKGSSFLNPQQERQRKELETSLSLKGIPIGSELFQREQERVGKAQGEEQRQLMLDAILAGGAESRAERASSLAEINPVLQQQGFAQGLTNLQPIDVAGIFQRSDQLKLQRSAQENERRQNRLNTILGTDNQKKGIFDKVSGAIATAFFPK